ncbi:MAG: alginate export family protein [Candidatus Omnitrophota bacterium]
MKLLKVFCVLVLVFAVSAIAHAETQSVKVSGDITQRAFARGDYDLDEGDPEAANGTESNDWSTYLLSTVEVQVDADLTDNVSGVIRLINQRVWGDGLYQSNPAGGELREISQNGAVGVKAVAPGSADAFEVGVDLAYIELKEFLYSPLTLRIGRQDLWFGKGFIIGANLNDIAGSIFPTEYTAVSSFDAVRATLDYDPWTIDAVYAKISENARRSDDDINLWGVNVGYVFDAYNAEAEAYWWFKDARNPGAGVGNSLNSIDGKCSNDVHVMGGRGSFDPIEDWTIAVEGAYQLGRYMVASQVDRRERSAWALDAMIECRYWQDDFAWRPVMGVEYVFYSGNENMGNQLATTSGDWKGWDPMYRGKFDTAIREFQNSFYATAMASSPSYTNQHQLLVTGVVEPTDSLTFKAKYGHFWLAEDWSSTNTDKNVGDEVDLLLTWDYTEDVQFSLLTAWFFPGDHFDGGQDSAATDIVGSVKLSF